MTILIPGIYGLDASSAWRTFSKDPQKYLDRVAKDKGVQKEIAYFNAKAPKFTSVDELIKDRRALQYLLDSYGLGSEINNAGRIKKILTEDPSNTNSLVNKLADPRFKTMANALRLDQGMTTLQRMSFRDVVQDKYVQVQLEVALGEQDPALRQAAYFARNSTGIRDVYSVLGDSILRDVVQNTYNLPAQIAIQPVETQARAISARVDVKKFADMANALKFGTSSLTNATNDHTLIEKNLAISDAARTQVKSVQDKLNQLVADYANLDAVTNPSGVNAATIAIQNSAVPQVIGFEQQLNAANKSVDSIKSLVTTMLDLVAQAQDPNNSLGDLKTQFASLVTSINTKLAEAGVTVPDGSTQNILLNGADDTVSIVLNDTNKTVTINRYNVTDLQSFITNAQASFNAITDSGDTSNILAAQGALLISTDQVAALNTTIESDISALKATTGGTLFAATLNTTSLLKGKQSVDDSLSRIAQIETLLTKIGALAKTAKGLSDSADHTAVEASFLDYRTQIRDLITTGGAGFDNFLNNSPDVSYEIIGGQNYTVSSGYDLLSSISDVLDANSISTQAGASALENVAITVTNDSDRLKAKLADSKVLLDRITSTYDPRAKLDLQLYDLQNSIEATVKAAAVNGVNLLDANQSDIKLLGLSSGANLTFTAQANFLSSVQSGLASIIAQFGNGATAVHDAVDDLSFVVDHVKMTLDSDNRRATMEYGRLGGIIDVLTPKDTSAAKTNYKTNAFTEKFLVRYLTLNGQSTSSTSGGNSFLLNLFGTSNSTTALNTISSLSVKV